MEVGDVFLAVAMVGVVAGYAIFVVIAAFDVACSCW